MSCEEGTPWDLTRCSAMCAGFWGAAAAQGTQTRGVIISYTASKQCRGWWGSGLAPGRHAGTVSDQEYFAPKILGSTGNTQFGGLGTQRTSG